MGQNMTTSEIIDHLDYSHKYHSDAYYAVMYHRNHKGEPITFDGYDYLKQIYHDKNPNIVVKKSTQAGLTEWLSVRAINSSIAKRNIFYVLPTGNLVSRFVKNRIDRTLDYTPYYKGLVKHSPFGFSESISLKHIGAGSISFVGSNASNAFTEFPADDLIVDELDECDQSNLNMGIERLSASKDPRTIKIGNPTTLNFGTDAEYNKSDQKKWFLKCSSCGEWQTPDFFINVVREVEKNEFVLIDKDWERTSSFDAKMMCRKCHNPLYRTDEGEWRSMSDSHISGYHISKLFSARVPIRDLLERFEEGLTDDSKLQRFYNGDLGLAFTASGAKLNYAMLTACKGDYGLQTSSEKPCIMGIDVGNKLHTIIGEIQPDGIIKTVYIGMENEKEDIFDLALRFHVRAGVIDGLPEQRLSKAICHKIPGMFRCFYPPGNLKVERVDGNNKIILADRTSSLDETKEMILLKNILLPRNADKMEPLASDGMSEFFYELTTSTRVKNEKTGMYQWIEGGNPDHFMHSLNYLRLAKKIILKVMK